MNDSFAANTKAAAQDLLNFAEFDRIVTDLETRPATLGKTELKFALCYALKELKSEQNERNLAKEQLEELKQQIRNIAL